MCCIVQIGMTIVGVVTLFRGSVSLTKKLVVHGTPAYWIGAILACTLPLALAVGFLIGLVVTISTPNANLDDVKPLIAGIEAVMVTVILLTVISIAHWAKRRQAEPDQEETPTEYVADYEPLPPDDNPYASPR